MAKKSQAALATVATLNPKRPEPPWKLPDDSTQLWKDICNSLPANHFAPGDLPLLTAYCLATSQKDCADTLAATEGFVINGKAHPALKLSMQLAATMATLAGKLRICQSSRTRPESASLKNAYSTGRRPWEIDENDPGEEYFKELDGR